MYINGSLAENETPVYLAVYKHMFYTKFNIKFQAPKKDTCLKCDEFQAQSKS